MSENQDIQAMQEMMWPATEAQTAGELWAIVRDALAMRPPRYVSSILGKPSSWLPPHRRYSEFTAIDLWHLGRTLKTLVNVTVPSIPLAPPTFGPPLLNGIFWQPTVILQRPDHHGSYTAYPDEAWFFINGIMTNDVVAQLNAAYLAYLFHRPLTLIQNSTDSWFVDLLQCALGKQWGYATEPATKALPAIYDALRDGRKRKVVVIAHSQGTLIAATLLRLLTGIIQLTERAAIQELPLFEPGRYAEPVFVYADDEPLDLRDFVPLRAEELAKLELYCFANCASTMVYHRPLQDGGRAIPIMESFGNEHDLVARLGMLAPQPARRGICIDGPIYMRPGAWGHLLTEHYLFALADAQRQGRRRGAQGGMEPYTLVAGAAPAGGTPRLFHYLNGGAPPDGV